MSIYEEMSAPVDTVLFRDLCIAFFAYAHKWCEENEAKFDLMLGGSMFVLDYLDPGESAAERNLYLACSSRLTALVRVLSQRAIDLEELVRPDPDPNVREIHWAVVEAAAVAPLREGAFDTEDILAEARPRVKQMDLLERIMGSNDQ